MLHSASLITALRLS